MRSLSALLCLLLLPVSLSAEEQPLRRVLLLHSYNAGYEWTDVVTRAIQESLARDHSLELYVEHMDSKRWVDDAHFVLVRNLLRHKYSHHSARAVRPDIIIASDDHALDFVLNHRSQLFPNIPVVFCGLNNFHPSRLAGHEGVTGVVLDYDFKGTIETVARLHPDLERIVVVGDRTLSGMAGLSRLKGAAESFSGRFAFDYLIGEGREALAEALSPLPATSVVLLLAYLRTGEDDALPLSLSRELVSSWAPVPVYAVWDFVPGDGLTGGRGMTGREQGRTAASMALRILAGEQPATLPVVVNPAPPFFFDHAALQRFAIPEERLPANAVVLGRGDAAEEQECVWMFAGAVFLALQLAILLGMLLARLKARRLEHQLRRSQKLEAVGRLAGGIAHDFRNQLTVIRGYCDMLLTGLPEGSPERHRVELIREAAQHSSRLTSQLLLFSRQERLQPIALNLGQVVEKMREALGRLVGERISLHTDFPPDLSPVWVDPMNLERALLNLVTNARDAMPDGGRLHIAARNVALPEVRGEGKQECPGGPFVLFEVTDTGTGMASEIRERVFDPFFTTKAVGAGTGLGLSMVHGFVVQSGGFIEVDSSPGRGSTFKLFFPSTAAAAVTPPVPLPAPVPGEPPTTAPATILVVEDNPALLELLVEQLTAAGHTVLSSTQPEEALRLAGDHPGRIDLLIADVVMPHLYGPEVAQRLSAVRHETAVLFISGYAERDGAGTRLPPDSRLLRKPFSRNQLLEAVAEALSGSRPAG